jgi:GR25 family glycosyltransferase involved in LPS biosynthesis
MIDFSEKNRSAYKLKNFGPVYCINLDGEDERWQWMEDQFKYWGIENYQRISACDGRGDNDLSDILKGRYPDNMSSGEVGCVTSHLKAMKHYLETSDSPYAIMMEDDCDLSLANCWNFTWSEIYAYFPYDWDVIQMSIICTGNIYVKLHKRFVNDFSTACYVVSRHHAEKLVRLHCRGDKFKLDQGSKPRAVADDLIYNSGNTFSAPFFLYRIEFPSAIHKEHVQIFHKNSHDGIRNFWQANGSMLNAKEIMDYDPYLGRVSESTPQEKPETYDS